VREQLRVAAGLPLSVTQEQISFRGHAIEARITAEDPLNRFLPASGRVVALRDPAGPGVRLDSALYDGMDIPLYYDSLLAKLICWGEDRAEAMARLRRALDEYVIAGVRTTVPFARWLLDQPRFVAGDFSTNFIAETWDADEAARQIAADSGGGDIPLEEIAALAAALAAQDEGEASASRKHPGGEQASGDGSRWRAFGRRAALGGGW
jgi:acetyl/propionyl-CoA carboxylase alpha subunit